MRNSTSRPHSSAVSTTSRCGTAPSASRLSSIASVALPVPVWSSPADASCGSASSVMMSSRGLASRSSTALLQVIKKNPLWIFYWWQCSQHTILVHITLWFNGSAVISQSRICTSTDNASDHVISHCYIPQRPWISPACGRTLKPYPR